MSFARDLKLASLVLPFLVAITALQSPGTDGPRTPAQSAEQKFHYIHANGQREHPDPRPTQLSELEANDYLASGKVRLPAGVQSVRLVGTPGVIQANCRIDFDAVRASSSIRIHCCACFPASMTLSWKPKPQDRTIEGECRSIPFRLTASKSRDSCWSCSLKNM